MQKNFWKRFFTTATTCILSAGSVLSLFFLSACEDKRICGEPYYPVESGEFGGEPPLKEEPEQVALLDGEFMSLAQAYENGFLTVDDLKSIAYYKHGGNRGNEGLISDDFLPAPKGELSEEVKKSIQFTYIDDMKRYNTVSFEPHDAEKVTMEYYGTYGESVVVMTDSPYVGYDAAMWTIDVGGILFYYNSGNRISVWVEQHFDEERESVAYQMGVEYTGNLEALRYYDPTKVRVEGLFSDFEHFGRLLRDSYAFPKYMDEEPQALTAMKERYTEAFFEEYALVIVKFYLPTTGGHFENISLSKRGNKLYLDYDYNIGYVAGDAISYPALVLEIKKADIEGVEILRVNDR